MSVDSQRDRLEAYVRDGYRLVGSVSVAIPLSRTKVRVLVEERAPIPDTIRFLLDFVDRGVNEVPGLSGFMGLNKSLVEAAVSTAYAMGYVIPEPGESLALTNQGARALHETQQLNVEQTEVEVAVDRLTGKAVPWDSIPYAAKQEPRWIRADPGLFEIPHPSRPPTLEDLDHSSGATSAIDAILKGRTPSPRRIETLAIEPPVRRFFRVDAYALQVVPLGGGDSQWDFLVGGVLSEPHAQGFLRLQKHRKRTILPKIEPHPLERFAYGLADDEIQETDRQDWKYVKAEAELEQRTQELADRITTAPRDTDLSQVKERLSRATQDLEIAREHPSNGTIQVLHVHDHRPFLLSGINEARYRVLIISPWIRGAAFDSEVEEAISQALERGVYVAIRYGYGQEGVAKRILKRLERLAERFPNFDYEDLGNLHTKLFAVDDRFVTAGSFNWLSFRGDPERTYREEKTYIVKLGWATDKEFADYLQHDVFLRTRPPGSPVEPAELDPPTNAVLFVEGWTDQQYMQIAAAAAGQENLLDGIEIRFPTSGNISGAKGAAREAIVFEAVHPGHPMIALFDSDDIGRACAKDVKRISKSGRRIVFTYGDIFEPHRDGAEAEHLFPNQLMHRFVLESGGEKVYDVARKDRDGTLIYELSADAKQPFVEWLKVNVSKSDVELWLKLVGEIRRRMKLDRVLEQ